VASSPPASETPFRSIGVFLVILGLLLMVVGIAAIAYQTCRTLGVTVCTTPYAGGGLVALVAGVIVLSLGLVLMMLRGPVVSNAPSVVDLAPPGQYTLQPTSPPASGPAGTADLPRAQGQRVITVPAVMALNSPPRTVAADRYCPSCSGGNARSAEFCDQCGQPLPPPP
jgi:hypothetical protein